MTTTPTPSQAQDGYGAARAAECTRDPLDMLIDDAFAKMGQQPADERLTPENIAPRTIPMTDTMLERMARAMLERKFGVTLTPDLQGQWAETFRDDWMDCARAALEAVRELTGGIVDAMQRVPGPDYGEADDAAMWRAAIDAILSESPPNG